MICYKLCIFIYLVVVGYSNPIPPSTDKEEVTEVTGPLNEEKFCDFPDVAEYRFLGRKWNKLDLTYRIVNYTSKWSNANVDSGIAKAVQWWSDVTPLKFTRIFSGNADIMIGFVYRDHGDKPFLVNTSILAHGSLPDLYPYSYIHFNDEKVSSYSEDWLKFVTVTAHEFGHVLGLHDSWNNNAVMFGTLGGRRIDCLKSDDIKGIQTLYGANPDETLLPQC
nr:72 kDa type IV collagenase-like [Misgurnus anguillicaudatus]